MKENFRFWIWNLDCILWHWIVTMLLAHRQAMNDSRELRRRLMKYLFPVVALSIAMNVTKFLEIELVFTEVVVGTVDGYNVTEWR